MDNYSPKRKIKEGVSPRKIWMTEKVLEKVRSKKAAFKTYQRTANEEDYRKYVRFRNQSRWETRKVKRDFEMKIAKEAKENPKAFYNFVNSRLKVKV